MFVFQTKEEIEVGVASLQFLKQTFRQYAEKGNKFPGFYEATVHALDRLYAHEGQMLHLLGDGKFLGMKDGRYF